MNLKKLIKKEIFITIISAILISITFFGVTYAIYMNVEENELGVLSFGDLLFEMCTDSSCAGTEENIGNVIQTDMYPMTDMEGLETSPYSFILTNSGTVTLTVYVYLGTNASNTYDYSKMRVAYKLSTDVEYTIDDYGENSQFVLDTITLDPGESKIINLMLWGGENMDNDFIGETFYGLVNAVAYYYPEDSSGLHSTYAFADTASLDLEKEYSYTGDYQTFEVPATGYYNVELWGASGGNSIGTSSGLTLLGGTGAYTSGEIYLTKGENLYVYVGQSGTGISSNTFNGGGNAGWNYDPKSGGGATDIRLVSGDWNNTTSLNSRIMTAAGGGGADGFINGSAGGNGGALIGNAGGVYNSGSYSYTVAGGGTQTTGGAGGAGAVNGYAGTFGAGGNSNGGHGGGGGGGYYGGGGAAYNSGVVGSGAGGASFISGYSGVNAVFSASSVTATNNTIHYSGKYFINSEMTSGVRSGNGKAKITFVGLKPTRTNTDLDDVRYIKDCVNGSTANTYGHWVELQAIYNGLNVAYGKTVTGTVAESEISPYSRITDGNITSSVYAGASTTGLQCVTVDLTQTYDLDEVAVWHYWEGGRTYYNNTTYVSSDNSTWTPVIANVDAETSQGKRVSAYDESVDLVPIFRYPNILTNSDFSSYTTTTYAWDNSLNRNPAIVPTNWFGGYNSGVTSPNLGYHARFDNAPFGYNVMVFPNLNSVIGIPNRWIGINQSFSAGTITSSTTYVVTMDIYDNAINHQIVGGIYYYNSSTSTWEFGSVWYTFTTISNNLNKWVTKQATITTPSTLSAADLTHFYVYGNYGSEGTAYVKNIYLVKK